MSLVLITGLPGTGKTTVCHELRKRGYRAYDGDEDGLAHWFNREGIPVPKSAEEQTAKFVATHVRTIARDRLEALAQQAIVETLFICNDPENEEELQDVFGLKIALVLDEESRQQRLDNRTNNSWGKLAHERAHDAVFVRKAPVLYRRYGYKKIDASQATTAIADQIIEYVKPATTKTV